MMENIQRFRRIQYKMPQPTLQQLMENDCYTSAQIEEVALNTQTQGYMDMAAVNLHEGFRRRLLFPVTNLNNAFSQEIQATWESIEQAIQSFVGSWFFEARRDLPKERISEIATMNHAYMAGKHKTIEVGDMSYAPWYEPLQPFASFADEKEFSRKYGLAGMFSWGEISGLDDSLRGIVSAFNKIPLVYSCNWSDSGLPSDRVSKAPGNWGKIRKDGKYFETMTNTLRVQSEPSFAGYIIFRHDEEDPKYSALAAELEQIEGVSIVDFPYIGENAIRKTLPEKKLVVKGNEKLIDKPDLTDDDLKLYEADLVQKWQRVKDVISKYIGK